MLFNSYIFFLAFLPIFLVCFLAARQMSYGNPKMRSVCKWMIIAGSLIFYAPFGARNLLVLLSSIAVDAALGAIIARSGRSREGISRKGKSPASHQERAVPLAAQQGEDSSVTASHFVGMPVTAQPDDDLSVASHQDEGMPVSAQQGEDSSVTASHRVGMPASAQSDKDLSIANSQGTGRYLFILGIVINVIVLLLFKFSGMVFGEKIFFPIAISFYTFNQISFLAETYRGEGHGFKLEDYLAYILFFPKLVQGPLMGYGEFVERLENCLGGAGYISDCGVNRDGMGSYASKDDTCDAMSRGRLLDWEMVLRGLYLFSMGLFKKVIMADTFGKAVDAAYSNVAGLGSLEAVLVAVFYSFQLYFDFSGYCDMATGICMIMGFDLPLNFDSPYKAVNIVDFWKRWHITLTKFFTKYVYIPLGGNRRGAGRMYLNFMVVFLVSGLWHGNGWTFIVWGAMHGILFVMTRALGRSRRKSEVNAESASDEKHQSEQKAERASDEKYQSEEKAERASDEKYQSEQKMEKVLGAGRLSREMPAKVNNDVSRVHEIADSSDEVTTVAAGSDRTTEKKIVADKVKTDKTATGKLSEAIRIILTFIYVTIAWVFFRAPSINDALTLLTKVFTGGIGPIDSRLSTSFQLDELWYVIKVTPIMRLPFAWDTCLWLFLIVGIIMIFFCKNAITIARTCRIGIRTTLLTVFLMIWSIVSFAGVSTFLYMNF
jgi:D-alanyl-lipoteichoic acid acyltransferase DltB (MBOAT superfamily)